MKGLRNIGWMCLAWTFFSCTSDLDMTQEGTTETDDEGAYFVLEVTAATGTSTRSNPTGGEPGDSSETGLDYENCIDDLMLFFYQAEKQSNASADTPIDKIFYFDRDKLEGDNRTEPVQVNLPAGEYDLLVVTNTGDMRAQLQGKTLGGYSRLYPHTSLDGKRRKVFALRDDFQWTYGRQGDALRQSEE